MALAAAFLPSPRNLVLFFGFCALILDSTFVAGNGKSRILRSKRDVDGIKASAAVADHESSDSYNVKPQSHASASSGFFIPSVYNEPLLPPLPTPVAKGAPASSSAAGEYSAPSEQSQYTVPSLSSFSNGQAGFNNAYDVPIPLSPSLPASSYGYLNETSDSPSSYGYGVPPPPADLPHVPAASYGYGYGYTDNNTRSLYKQDLECLDGFNTLVQDLGLISLILSVISLIIGILSLMISNFYNVWGSALSLLFVGLPSAAVSVLNLLGAGPPSNGSPLVVGLTIKGIIDALNNLLSVVPGSLFSDSLALISLFIGKVSLGIGFVSSYPVLLERILTHWGIKEFVDKNYACQSLRLGEFVQNWFYGHGSGSGNVKAKGNNE